MTLLNNKIKLSQQGSGKVGFAGIPNIGWFTIGFGLNMLSSLIDNTTSMIAKDAYSNNPNPAYGYDNYSWGNAAMRFSPDVYRSSYSYMGW